MVYGPGHDPQHENLVGSWVAVTVAVVGAWAIDTYAVHTLGDWRYVPVAVLVFFAFVAGSITLLLTVVANEASLELTDTHLILRGWLRKRRWAWTDLREIRVVEVAWPAFEPLDLPAEKVDILTLVRVSGPMVPLPAPFRKSMSTEPDDADTDSDSGTARLEPIVQQLNAALRLHHPLAEPLDDAEAAAATAALNESMESAERRRATRDKHWSKAAVPLVIIVVLFQIIRATQENTHQTPWVYVSAILLCSAAAQVFSGTRWLPRLPKRWRHMYLLAAVLMSILVAVLYAKSH